MTLHSEKDAIKQAVEAGYSFPIPDDGKRIHILPLRRFGVATALKMWSAYILQDPAFWQALGKARGWLHTLDSNFEDWKSHALRYLETRLSNGDMKAFWESLP